MVICVECSAPVSCIYRRFPSSSHENIRLQRCDACGAIADKYVEYEGLLLFVELLLHKPQTYRHILFNRLPYADAGLPPPLYRLAAACIIFDAYTLWFLLHVDHARFLFPFTKAGDGSHEADDVLQQQGQHRQQQQQQQQLHHQHQHKVQQQSRRITQHEDTSSTPHFGELLPNREIWPEGDVPFSRASSGVVPGTRSSATADSYRYCCVHSPSGNANTETSSAAGPACCATRLKALTSVPATTSPEARASAPSWLSKSATDASSSATLPPVACLSSVSSASASPHCRVVLQNQNVNNNRKNFPDAALSSGGPPVLHGPAAGAAAEHRESDGSSLPSYVRGKHQRRTRALSMTQHPRPSSASASDAERHADMLRWLLHNPLISADQQLLILSVSIVDFVVYFFAIIFFTDLFLRFFFRRRRRQQGQRRPPEKISGVCTLPNKAMIPLLQERMSLYSFRSCHTLYSEDAAGSEAELQRRRKMSDKAVSSAAEKRTRRSNESAEEIRHPNTQRKLRYSVEEERQLNADIHRTIDKATTHRREGQRQQEEGGDVTSRTLPAIISDKEKRVAQSEERARTEGDGKAKTVELGFIQKRDKHTLHRDREKKEEGKLTSTGSVTTLGCCISWARASANYVVWTKSFLAVLSSVWKFSLLSFSTAAREVVGVVFGCAKHEEGFATENSGVVLIKYNYLAAAVTLSMFGKLGTLILIAWEESLSPRCFTSLFTFTSNVLAVDVFLNGQHHAAAAAIVTAAATVRAIARLAQQLAFPSVTFPPCVVPGAETQDAHQFTSLLLNFLSLLL